MANIPEKALDARRRIREGTLEGPRLLVVGPALEGPPAEADYNTWIVKAPEDARQTVDKLVAMRVDFIKVHDHISKDAFHAIAGEAKSKGIPFVGHVSEHITPAEASDLGQRSIEHFEFLPKPCLAILDPKRTTPPPVCDHAALDSLMKTFAKNGTWLDPTAGAFRFFDPSTWPATKAAYRNLAALMRSNGVKILAGTDQSSYLESKGSVPGQSLHEEMGFFIDAGFTPAEALRAATSGPAEFLGIADRAGTIQAGRSADLVLLDADPLQDIRKHKAHCRSNQAGPPL